MDKATLLQMIKELKRNQARSEFLMDSIISGMEQIQDTLSKEDLLEIRETLHDENIVAFPV